MTQEEIKAMSAEDLKAQVATAKEELYQLKISNAISPIENPIQLRSKRREIARMLTEITQKESNV